MNNSITKHLIFEHFAGRLTPLERSQVAQWLQAPINRELYYEWMEEWERQNLQYVADDEGTLRQLLGQLEQWQLHQPELMEQPMKVQRNFLFRRWMSIAATLFIGLLVGAYTSRSYWQYQTVETTFGEVRRITLPDGSSVTLNANSSLKLPRFGFGRAPLDQSAFSRAAFGAPTRQVEIRGEAAFSVKHTRSHQPFVVRTPKGVDVVVLGTEFNVYARPRRTQVVLNRGEIQLNYHSLTQPRQMVMRPGDQVSVDPSGKLALQHGVRAEVVTAWMDRRFVFSQTSITEIVAIIKENYNLTVKLKDRQLAGRTVSGTFQANNADEFIQIIAELLEINYNRRDNTVTFFE